jgi:hypothetical protein
MHEPTIADMKPGDEGWIQPSAAHRPKGLFCRSIDYYLNADYPVKREPFGTSTLRVFRDNAGYHVDDSRFHKGIPDNTPDRYHSYWLGGRSVWVRSVTL